MLCPFQFSNHLDDDERAGCFTLVVFLTSFDCDVLWYRWLGCAVLNHTHLIFWHLQYREQPWL